jgi:hypothetical protein
VTVGFYPAGESKAERQAAIVESDERRAAQRERIAADAERARAATIRAAELRFRMFERALTLAGVIDGAVAKAVADCQAVASESTEVGRGIAGGPQPFKVPASVTCVGRLVESWRRSERAKIERELDAARLDLATAKAR